MISEVYKQIIARHLYIVGSLRSKPRSLKPLKSNNSEREVPFGGVGVDGGGC